MPGRVRDRQLVRDREGDRSRDHHQQGAQSDALSPSTRQVSTIALELGVTPQSTNQARSLRSLVDKPLAVVNAGTQDPLG